ECSSGKEMEIKNINWDQIYCKYILLLSLVHCREKIMKCKILRIVNETAFYSFLPFLSDWERLSEDCGGSCTKTCNLSYWYTFSLVIAMNGCYVHIADLYVVATWKDPQVNLSKDILLFPAWSRQAGEADHYLLCACQLSSFNETFFFLQFFPQQFMGNCCGIFMLMVRIVLPLLEYNILTC
uniref:Uncharacterized protein n=1 Tax=Nothobranchius furzeri TaxID=105023 RepID=A0A8C6K8N7_NOTFU